MAMNDKRHTKMGKSIGFIKEDVGFIPNSPFACDTEISCFSITIFAFFISIYAPARGATWLAEPEAENIPIF